jgi:hypothetical protein
MPPIAIIVTEDGKTALTALPARSNGPPVVLVCLGVQGRFTRMAPVWSRRSRYA